MTRKTKSSSGDLSYVNPYMRIHRGSEVTTSRIIRKKNGKVEVIIYNKVL